MIEVKMFLYDADEIALFARFNAIIDQKRSGTLDVTPAAPASTPPAPAASESPLNGVRVEAPTDTVVMNASSEPVEPREVSDIEMQQTITAYGNKHGIAATKEKMQREFGVSRALEVPANTRALFVEAFRV